MGDDLCLLLCALLLLAHSRGLMVVVVTINPALLLTVCFLIDFAFSVSSLL